MPAMLLAYGASGEVVATLDHMIAKDDDSNVVGLVDFETHELAGGRLRDLWGVSNAVGSGTWPEWIGGRAHDFRVELEGPPGRKRIKALVHRTSGVRRERAVIEAAIDARIRAANGAPADIRDLVGGPDSPLQLDAEGRTRPRGSKPQRPALPVLRSIVGS